MNLETRLRRLSNFKFCPLCGADWQERQRINREEHEQAKERIQEIVCKYGVEKKQEILEKVKELAPTLQYCYDSTRKLGWRKEDVPFGFCSACGKDLLLPEERKQQDTQAASEKAEQLLARLKEAKQLGDEEALAYLIEHAPTLTRQAGRACQEFSVNGVALG